MCIRDSHCSSFSAKSPAAPTLLACKRALGAPACYQLFAGLKEFNSRRRNAKKIFFMWLRHAGAKSALLRLIFCLWL